MLDTSGMGFSNNEEYIEALRKECMNYKCGTSKFEWNGKLEVINNG